MTSPLGPPLWPGASPTLAAIVLLVGGLALAASLRRARRALVQASAQAATLAAQAATLAAQAAAAEARATQLGLSHEACRAQLAVAEGALVAARSRQETTLCELAEAREARRAQVEHALAQVQQLTEVRQSFADHFRALSQEVLAEKAALFDRQQRAGLQQLVDPLHKELTSFRQRVDEVWRRDGEERAGLGEKLAQIAQLAQGLGAEARTLTQALRGDHRTQGAWGEMVLQRLLEACGLHAGEDFVVQPTFEDGERRARPDIVVHLPEERDVVIDAKVSLTDYYDRVQADSEGAAKTAADRHVQALRAHIRSLSDKDYPALYGLKSLDCTLLFVPVEPAFLCALETDPGLWEHAWKKKIVLVCPTTLLCVLRIVADQWRQSRQSRHAQDIANRGARIYDKFVGVMADFEQLGRRMSQAQECYQGTMSKMTHGRGNLIAQFEVLRKKGGLSTSKQLPRALCEAALPDEDVELDADAAAEATREGQPRTPPEATPDMEHAPQNDLLGAPGDELPGAAAAYRSKKGEPASDPADDTTRRARP